MLLTLGDAPTRERRTRATVSAIARRAGVAPCTVLDQLSAHRLLTDDGGASLEAIGHEPRVPRRRATWWLRVRKTERLPVHVWDAVAW